MLVVLSEGFDNVLDGGTESDETESIIDVWIADVFIDVANDVERGARIVVLGDDGT